MRYYIFIIAIIVFQAFSAVTRAQVYTSFDVISSGGGKSDAGSYSNFGVIGESFVNSQSLGGNYLTGIGFLSSTDFFVGISDINTVFKGLRVFPNPASEIIWFMDNEHKVKSVVIISIAGVKIKESVYHECLDVSFLLEGIYLVKAFNDHGECISIARLIKL